MLFLGISIFYGPLATVLPAKSDSDVMFYLQILSY